MKESYKKYYEEKEEKKSDEEIDKEITERLTAEYENQSEWRLNSDIRKHFVKKAAVELPEAFLKRWLAASNEEVKSEELEKEFPAFGRFPLAACAQRFHEEVWLQDREGRY